jgi:hypothetical protein
MFWRNSDVNGVFFANKSRTLGCVGREPFKNPEFLAELERKNFHVLALVKDVLPKKRVRSTLPVTDIPSDDGKPGFFSGTPGTDQYIYDTIELIHDLLKQKKRVLLVCGAGMHSSRAIAGSYLIIKKGANPQKLAKKFSNHSIANQKSLDADFAMAVPKYFKHASVVRNQFWARHFPWTTGIVNRIKRKKPLRK